MANEIPKGTYNSVAELETLLRKADFIPNMRAEWRRDQSPVLVIEGSRVNGFYVAELR